MLNSLPLTECLHCAYKAWASWSTSCILLHATQLRLGACRMCSTVCCWRSACTAPTTAGLQWLRPHWRSWRVPSRPDLSPCAGCSARCRTSPNGAPPCHVKEPCERWKSSLTSPTPCSSCAALSAAGSGAPLPGRPGHRAPAAVLAAAQHPAPSAKLAVEHC